MKMTKITGTRFITTTAMLLALTIVFQMLRILFPFISVPLIPGIISLDQLLVGSLVNLCLLVAAALAGVWSGVIIGIAAPVVALIQGHLLFVWMLPFVAIGNVLIVICYALLRKKSQILGFTVGAIAKTVFLWIGIVAIGIALFNVQGKQAAALSLAFTWPQLITGLIGGFVSIPVVRALTYRKSEA
jgi:hypothetical protein